MMALMTLGLAGCQQGAPMPASQGNVPPRIVAPATEASAIQSDANGRIVRRQWAVSDCAVSFRRGGGLSDVLRRR